VRRALEQLVDEGLIVRVAGRGTWPTPGKPLNAEPPVAQGAPTRLTGLMENIVSVSRHTTVKVLDWRVVDASASVALALQLASGAKVRKAVRRRSSQEGPLSYITTYMPEHLATISARQADALVAAELDVAIGTALLDVRRLVFDAQDKPVQWLHGLYRPDRYEYQLEVSQVGSIDARISVKDGLHP
jgi:GntR family transcriptional regulator